MSSQDMNVGVLDLAARIDEWIACNRERMIADIVALVRIRSVSQPGGSEDAPYGAGCREALDAMLRMGARDGFATESHGNRIGIIDFGNEAETLGFWGHLDVVPEGDGWDYPPYEGIVKEGVIIGRGSQDNKGQTVAVLHVMRCIRELGIPLAHNLKLYVGTNEECGMGDIVWFADRHPLPAFSIIADSNYPVCYGEKGIITARLVASRPLGKDVLALEGGTASNVVPSFARAVLRKNARTLAVVTALQKDLTVNEDGDNLILTAAGITGHTAFPENSRNAIHVMTEALGGCGLADEADAAIFSFLNLVNGGFHGEGLGISCMDEDSGMLTCVGSIIRVDEGVVTLTVNIRFPISGSAEDILGRLARTAEAHGFSLFPDTVDGPHAFPKDHPVVSILTDVYNRSECDDKQPFVLAGGTYARKLKNAISFGMGFGKDTQKHMEPYQALFRPGHGGAHGPDECAIIDLLCRSIKIYVLGLVALDGVVFASE